MTGHIQPLFLAIEGPAGSGKSKLCTDLHAAFPECAFIDSDLIKLRSFNSFDKPLWLAITRTHGASWRREIGDRVAVFWCSELCRLGRPIIIEYSDTFTALKRLNKMCSRHNYDFRRYLLLPPLVDCLARIASRNAQRLGYPISRRKVAASHHHFQESRNSREYTLVCETRAELHAHLTGILTNRQTNGANND